MPNWKRRQINQRFLRNLRARFGRRYFTTQDAQNVYREDHWENSPRSTHPVRLPSTMSDSDKRFYYATRTPNQFTDMSARNSISAAAYFGELIRVRKGVYRFPTRKEVKP